VDLSEATPSKNQKEKLFKKLRDQCRKKVSEVIVPLLIRDLAAIASDAGDRVVVESLESARDPFVVCVKYPGSGLNPPDEYFQPTIKIELSGRAEGVPVDGREIIPYVLTSFPQLATAQNTVIPCVRPVRTFWEKAALLHEQNSKTSQTEPGSRQSRHLYDLHQLWTVGGLSATISAADPMFRTVMDHRSSFFPYGQVNHLELAPGDLMLIPPPAIISAWRTDFEKMGSMFFGDSPTFDQVLATVRLIQETLGRP
jgi:hypothetical protein